MLIVPRITPTKRPYLEALLKEWQMYIDVFPGRLNVKELHIGGGTPTFFSPENLIRLIDGICKNVNKMDNYMFSFETNPRSTSREHLEALVQRRIPPHEFRNPGFRSDGAGGDQSSPVIRAGQGEG